MFYLLLLTYFTFSYSSITFIYPSKSNDICQVSFTSSYPCTIAFSSTTSNSYTLSMMNVDNSSVASSKTYTFNANISSLNRYLYDITYSIAYGNYLIKLYDNTDSVSYTQQFVVVAELLNILTPNSTTNWRGGSTHNIEWTRYPSVSHTVSLSYSLDSGSTYTSIISSYGAYGIAYNSSGNYVPTLSYKYSYTWILPNSLNGNIMIKVIDAIEPSYPLVTSSFTISNYSTSWSSIKGLWQGTEVRKTSSSGSCVTTTCNYLSINITDTILLQTYPPNSDCVTTGSQHTTISRLGSASFDGTYVKNDASGACIKVVNDGTTMTWTQSYTDSTTCYDTISSSCDSIVTTLTYTTNPYANLIGTWNGNVYYAVPDTYGGCVTGSCSSEVIFSADGTVATTWPLDCQPGAGTSLSNLVPANYDGTFYQNSGSNKCLRMVYAGKNLYLTQSQSSNVCLNNEASPSCTTGGVLLYQSLQKSGSVNKVVAFSFILIGICVILLV